MHNPPMFTTWDIANCMYISTDPYSYNRAMTIVGYLYVTGPAKSGHVSAKNSRFLACLLYHNLITVYTTATKSSSLLQNVMGIRLQLTEMR